MFLLFPARTSAYIRKFCRVGNSTHIIVNYTGFGLLKSNLKPPVFQNAQIINLISAYLHGSPCTRTLD